MKAETEMLKNPMSLGSKFKGILFDLDGTLVDSLSMTFDAFNHGIQVAGSTTKTPDEIMAHFGMGEDAIFERLVGKEKAAMAYEACVSYTDAHLPETPLHSGVLELLTQFKTARVPMSIVTGRSWNTTELILRHHGILSDFVTVIAHDHVNSGKPSPEGLELALSRMKLTAAETCYVGDSPMDIQAARRAGMEGIAALWDRLATRERFEALPAHHRPHHWTEHPAQVWDYFNAT